jgi:phospholipase/lecithinase/hemolysin
MKIFTLKRIFALFISLFAINSYASSLPFDHIVFFGDSLSDNGNLYSMDFGLLPKSPPYYKGRFSNGPVWSEQVAANFFGNNNIVASNYAVGGETVQYYSPPVSALPYDLSMSFYEYLLRNLHEDHSHTLFVIWIGGNDYLARTIDDADQFTTDVINTLHQNLEAMISRGVKYFVVMNLPDLGKMPYARLAGMEDSLTKLTNAHNTKLETMVIQLRFAYPDIKIHLYDVNTLFSDLLAHTDTYNQKYNLHLSNLTEACWTGGNTLNKLQDSGEISQTLQLDFNKLNKSTKINFAAMANGIKNNPALNAAYQVGQLHDSGVVPCSDPDAYVFWDSVHPSAVTHTVISAVMTDDINENFSNN